MLAVVGLLLILAGDAAPEQVQTRSSDPLQDKRSDWRDSGFRLRLALGYEFALGWQGPTEPSVLTSIHAGWRFTESWGGELQFRYGILYGSTGVRWSALAQPVWHITDGLSLVPGIGYAGVLDDRDDGRACHGDGIVGSVELRYEFIVGDLFATGPTLHADAQWLRCRRRGAVDRGPQDGQWAHGALGLRWIAAWR